VTALLWYNKAGDDLRPWLVREESGKLRKAARVRFDGQIQTLFYAEGNLLLPGGPRGVIQCDGAVWLDDAEDV
jgi:hypothetical protein